jgi:hypothetical protein
MLRTFILGLNLTIVDSAFVNFLIEMGRFIMKEGFIRIK